MVKQGKKLGVSDYGGGDWRPERRKRSRCFLS
uniref:ATOZI1 n=1 Tax=Rhizophora mucronata TaxID=61149 RepID=A0A2P2IJ37_RHIMU